ncbi:hypothetical protein TorRG33x02_096620 [Trema orientale]|uniref:Uncharacterized protein n=1 Tax=Trema orientale TaxID=63057 RepID=A0A2P5FA14_TREOI|nr:hypothetical protein TorRG33x02_096620 [Trema orientale]
MTIFFFLLQLPHSPSNPPKNPSNSTSVSNPCVLFLNSSPNGSSRFPNATKSTSLTFQFDFTFTNSSSSFFTLPFASRTALSPPLLASSTDRISLFRGRPRFRFP